MKTIAATGLMSQGDNADGCMRKRQHACSPTQHHRVCVIPNRIFFAKSTSLDPFKIVAMRNPKLAVATSVLFSLCFTTRTTAFLPANHPPSWIGSRTTPTTATVPTFGVVSSSSARAMGMFEDMLAGRDATQREKENAAYLSNQLQELVERINAMEAAVEDLGDDELMAKTKELQKRLREDGEDLNGKLLEEAFAVVREAAWYVCEHCEASVQQKRIK